MKSFFSIFSHLRNALANRTDPEGLQLLARIFWRSTLLLGILAFLVSSVFGAIQLFEVLGTFGEPQLPKAESAMTFDAKKLDAVLAEFDARAERREAAQSATSTVVDPSR